MCRLTGLSTACWTAGVELPCGWPRRVVAASPLLGLWPGSIKSLGGCVTRPFANEMAIDTIVCAASSARVYSVRQAHDTPSCSGG